MSVIRQSPDNFRVLRLRAPERISNETAFRSVGGGWLFFTGVFALDYPSVVSLCILLYVLPQK